MDRELRSQKIKAFLLDGSTISLRPLTIAERRQCIKKFPAELLALKDLSGVEFVDKYTEVTVDLIHYIITRTHKDFTKKDVEEKLDSSLIEQIVLAVLKDPLSELLSM